MRRAGRSAIIAGGMVLLFVGVVPAQTSSSGGFSGSSGSSRTSSSSSGGFTGSPGTGGSSGIFSGSPSATGSTGRTGTGTGASTLGSTTPFGRFYGNPLYNHLTSTQTGQSGKFTAVVPVYPSSYVTGFGTPQYDAATLARSATQGTTGLGTQNNNRTTNFAGASSAGIRRAPGYIAEPVFDMPARPTLAAIQPELQSVVSRATRLPSRDRIQVLTDGETIVLRGQVRDERERRLAEAMIRLSPGVRTVRNELEPEKQPPPK